MRITVLTNDTRGGVQPYVALAVGLRAAGHEVRAVAPAELAHLFGDRAIPVLPLDRTQDAMAIVAGGVAERGTLSTMRLMRRELPGRLAGWMRNALAAAEDADLMVGGIGGMVIGQDAAARLRLPFIAAHLQPVDAPVGDYPGVLFPNLPRWVGPWGRRLSHFASDAAIQMPFRRAMRIAAKEVFGDVGNRPKPPLTIYGFSRLVVPLGDTATRRVTGYWTAPDPGWSPPPALEAFLADGRPVVSIGFGSMGNSRPEEQARLAIAAARENGLKVVMLGGWNGLRAEASADVHVADALPHDWLFPKMSVIVHHGGAGTTGAALMAGVPSVVVPFAVDQPFWGMRVHALGVGPQPLSRRRLTVDRLSAALREALQPPIRQRAAALGARLGQERGVELAVDLIGKAGGVALGGTSRRAG